MELCLGTVQLGLNYGIAGGSSFTKGQALQLLNNASQLGIKVFDTALAYGNAEILLGEFLSACEKKDIRIISKCSSNKMDLDVCLFKSLKNLNINQIDGYLFHDVSLIYDEDTVRNMISLKKRGYIKHIGVSIYQPEDAIYAARQTWVDYIQIPYNVLDQRLDKINFFGIVKENNKKIFARSALLQGLLTMSLDDIKDKLEFSYDYLHKYIHITEKYNCSKLEAAIQFVKSNNNIDYLVFGVYSDEQLKEFVRIFNKDYINCKMIKELRDTFDNVNERVISPNLW